MSLLGTSLIPALSVSIENGSEFRPDSLSPSAATDRFQFVLTTPSSFRASLYSPSSATTVTLIRDTNLNQRVEADEILNSQTTSGNTPTNLEISTLNAGTYYLIVSATNLTQSIDYTLQTSRTSEIDTDILWRNPTTQEIGYWRFDGTTFLGTQRIDITQVSNEWQIVGIGDFNGDRLDDFAWRNPSTNEVGVWVMGRQVSGQRQIEQAITFANRVGADWQVSGIGDLDGDGKADWIWRNPSQQQVGFWLVDGARVRHMETFAGAVGAEWSLEGVADFDGNGRADLFWRNRTTSQTATWLMNGTALNQATVLSATATVEWRVEGFGDFSSDGRADILWRNTTTGQIGAWLVDGRQILQAQVLSLNNLAPATLSLDWQVVGIEDIAGGLGGDRRADIIWRQTSTGRLEYWQMEGLRVVVKQALSNPTIENPALRVIGTTNRLALLPELLPLDTTPPIVSLNLEFDTGTVGDQITRIPAIQGRITDNSGGFKHVFASLNQQSFFEIRSWMSADGSLTLNQTRLQTLLGSALSDRDYTLNLRATDIAGNLTHRTLNWTLDTQAPTAPTNLRVVANPSGAANRPTIAGVAEANARVVLSAGSIVVGETRAAANGQWQIETAGLSHGSHGLSAVAIDAAGNESTRSTALAVTIATPSLLAPQNVRLTTSSDVGASNSDNITSVKQPSVTGTALAGTTIKLYHDSQLLGQTITNSAGEWTLNLTTALPDGTHRLSAIASNATGESLATWLQITVDSALPTLAVETLVNGQRTALANGMVLRSNTRLIGAIDSTGSAIATLMYRIGANGTSTPITVSEDGLFNQVFDWTGVPNGATTLVFTVVDVAGNTRQVSYTVTIDKTQPPVGNPTLVTTLIKDSGNDVTDGWTDTPGFTGVVTELEAIAEFEARLVATGSPTSGVPFVNLRSIVAANGTFLLDADRLAALWGKELGDGQYTLQLRTRATNGTWAERSAAFTLDRTAPTFTAPDLIDGIDWKRGTSLKGTIVDQGAVEVKYWFEETNGARVVSERSVTVTDGSLNQALPELAEGNKTLKEEKPYDLVMTSTDRAGNQQRTRFQFFLKSDRKVEDDDRWEQSPPGQPAPEPPHYVIQQGWGQVGSGGAWGGPYSSFTPGGIWKIGGGALKKKKEELEDEVLIGDGYEWEFEYAGGVGAIVETAVNFISAAPATNAKKAALNNRRMILVEIAERFDRLIHADGNFRNDQALIDRLAPVMEGLFVDAYAPAGRKAGVPGGYQIWGGGWLAQELVADERSVRVQVFQATLLAVVVEALKDRSIAAADYQKLVDAILTLGNTYAWLNPDAEVASAVPQEDKDYAFLNRLWRLQVRSESTAIGADVDSVLQESVDAVGRLLKDVEDPVRAIQFISGLLTSTSNVSDLKDEVKNAEFLRKLLKLGIHVAQINPALSEGDPVGREEWLQILWEGRSDTRLATAGITDVLNPPISSQKQAERLEYLTQIVKAVQLVDDSSVKSKAQSTANLSYLLDLGSSYNALQLNANNASSEQSFLTLVAQGNLRAASNELEQQISKALRGIQVLYDGRLPVTQDNNGWIVISDIKIPPGAKRRFGYDVLDKDPNNDRYPILYRILRKDGPVEAPVPGDTLFTIYAERGSTLDPYGLYPGDVLLYPTTDDNRLGKGTLWDLASQRYKSVDKVLDALRLAPFIAGPQIQQFATDVAKVIKEHPFWTTLAVGGFAAAQFTPLGVPLNVGLILLGGAQAGFSLGSFIYKAATATTQEQLWDAARTFNQAIADLLTIGGGGGLLKLNVAEGIQNLPRLLDAGFQLWRRIDGLFDTLIPN